MSWLFVLVAAGAGVAAWFIWRTPGQVARLPGRDRSIGQTTGVFRSHLPAKANSEQKAVHFVGLGKWRKRNQSRDFIMQALVLLDADLRAGASPQVALSSALNVAPSGYCAHTLAACRGTGEIAAGLQADSREHGEITWALLGSCWAVSERYGASLSTMLRHVLGVCRQQRRAEQQLRAQLAAPQAGAKLLAGLPILGLGLGFLLGANPISWLLGSAVGLAVLVIAICFEGAGLWWVSRIVKKAKDVNDHKSALSRSVPLAAYLVASSAKAGVSLPAALEATARALGEPIGQHLMKVLKKLRLGADPTAAWAPLIEVRELSLLAQVMARSAVTGAAVSDSLLVVAEAAQDELATDSERRARVAGVKVVAPLALCFLPAFLLVTVIPIVGSLLPTVLVV